jgi:opacity protein-like surface antigen
MRTLFGAVGVFALMYVMFAPQQQSQMYMTAAPALRGQQYVQAPAGYQMQMPQYEAYAEPQYVAAPQSKSSSFNAGVLGWAMLGFAGTYAMLQVHEGPGKGFGGGEATRDPEPTALDPNDPKGKQQAIHKAESFQDYLARRAREQGQ